MGQQHSVDPIHARMYTNMIQIRDPVKRIQIINTCMASMEYIQSAKRSGVYSYLMHYISTVQSGGNPPMLPGESDTTRQGGTPQQPQQSTIVLKISGVWESETTFGLTFKFITLTPC